MSATGLDGQIQGSIKSSDIQSQVIPALAANLTEQVQADPNSSSAQQIEATFDVGGCGNAQANDQRIDPCELAGNAIIQQVFAPDVQIYDANGNYAPNPSGAKKDSWSFGIAFTAVKATFQP